MVEHSDTRRVWRAARTPLVALGFFAACVPKQAAPGTAAQPAPGAAAARTAPSRTGAVKAHGQLSVEGAKIVDQNGAPVVLRGQAHGWDNWWPQYYNADVVRWLRDDWCVDIVRPAMGIEPDGAYLSNPAASTQHVTAVVDAAIASDLYVLIDWHAHDLHQAEAVGFFSDMAERYGRFPNVIYEIFNEPEQDETWPQVKEYATAVIAAIRQHDPDNLVVVGSPEWDQRIDLVQGDPLEGQSNVVYSVHFYAGTHGQWLRDRVKAAVDAGIPVMVTESSGAEASGQGQNNYDEWNAWIQFMEQNQISWLNYSVSDKAGETISVLEPGASAAAGWSDGELTESGRYVRDLLRQHCD